MSDDREELLQRTLLALDFWLPKVPADGPAEIVDRIENDAALLVHRTGDMIEDAESLGWIRLRDNS